MSDWREIKVVNLASPDRWSLNGGPFGSKLVSAMYTEMGVPVIRGGNLPFEQRFLDDNFVFVSADKAQELQAHSAAPGDIIITQRGTLGQVGVIPLSARFPRYIISQSQMKLTVAPEIAEPMFVYYYFKSPLVNAKFVGLASTSGVPHVNLQTLREFTVALPPIETQRRIASVLGAYDDLIEINRRRIAVLEEMARGLFEEWFVRFRFPGYEAVPILDTPDGPLPEGWISQTVGDTFELLGGGTPSKAKLTYWTDGTIDWFTPSDLTKSKTLFMDRSGDRITPLGLAKSSAKLFPPDSVMMTSRATIGEISICTGSACTNQGFITCLPNEAVPRSYLYFWLLQNVPLFIAHATGATFKEITKGVFKRLPITVPSQVITVQFDEQVRPIHDMILALECSNRRLASSRDLLLPRLISGQLAVAEAERQLEEAA